MRTLSHSWAGDASVCVPPHKGALGQRGGADC